MTAEEILTTIVRDRLHVHPLEYPNECPWMVCRHGQDEPRFVGATLPEAVAKYVDGSDPDVPGSKPAAEDFLE